MIPFKTDIVGKLLPIKSEASSKFISLETIKAFFHELAPQEKKQELVCLIMLTTGLRISEVLQIQVQDFVPGTQFKWLQVLIEKRNKENCILKRYLPESVAAVVRDHCLKNWLAIVNHENYIFFNACNNSSQFYTRRMFHNWWIHKRNELAKKYPSLDFTKKMGYCVYKNKKGCKGFEGPKVEPRYSFSPHAFRRLFITLGAKNTTPIAMSCIIGHKDLSITMSYIDNYDLAKKQMQLEEELFGPEFYEDYIKDKNPDALAVWDNILPHKTHSK